MKNKMKALLICAMIPLASQAQCTFENQYTKSLHDVMDGLQKRYQVKFKYTGVDTTGMKITYADFRLRPYSLEESLRNVLAPLDLNYFVDGNGKSRTYRIRKYRYPMRHDEEGKAMLDWLSGKYSNKEQWESRRDSLRREVRRLLGVDDILAQLVHKKAVLSSVRKYDGYTVQNICIETLPGQHVFGTIYAPVTKGKHPLIMCPMGHFQAGRFFDVQQKRLGTLARMGAICVDMDLYGWGQSEGEVGKAAHETSKAHQMQAVNGIVLLDWTLANRKDIDRTRIGVNGASGGGTQSVLYATIDDRYTAMCPTVNLASHFDGGCPCESGMPIQLACGGTCNPELAATFAPKPLLIISDGGDWTHTVPYMEYPFVKRIYGFYGAENKVENVHLPDEGHDFGANKRKAVYDFFVRVFGLDRSKVDEDKVTVETVEQLTCKTK